MRMYSDLWWEINKAPIKTARRLFPKRGSGYVSATKALGNLASNRVGYEICKERMDRVGMKIYKDIMDRCVKDAMPHANTKLLIEYGMIEYPYEDSVW